MSRELERGPANTVEMATQSLLTKKEYQEMIASPLSEKNRNISAELLRRNARMLLDADTANKAESTMFCYTNVRITRTGTQVLRHKYAPAIPTIAFSFGWDEPNTDLTVFAASIYKNEVDLASVRIASDSKREELKELSTEMNTAIEVYTATRPTTEDISLILEFYSLKESSVRLNLLSTLRLGQKEKFYQKMAKLVAGRTLDHS